MKTTMGKRLGYIPRQNTDWDTLSQDYQAHLSRTERKATIIPGAPQYPNVHRAFNKVEVPEEDDQSSSAESVKKVQVVDLADEATIDAEADGYSQQTHKGFEV